MFLAVLRVPTIDDADARAATATGLARADVKRRLVGVLPRVLLSAADRGEIEAARQRLEAAGFGALAFDPLTAPSDGDRVIARSLEPTEAALIVVAGVGGETRHAVPWEAIELIQRGVRDGRRRETITTTTRQLAVGRTLLAGGMPMTKKVEKTETVSRGDDEPFALLNRSDGGDDVILYERRLSYAFLGPQREPTSRINLERTVALIAARSLAPIDDRVARAGFVSGLPVCAADPVDVAIHLVRLARRVG